MSDLTTFALANGGTVTVAPINQTGAMAVGHGSHLLAAEQTWRHALEPVTRAASEALERFQALPRSPDEVEVTFGVNLDGKFGGLIASASVGSHLQVTLRWKKDDEPAG